MNQNADVLLKLIIPAIFLLIWAVSQVLSKESPPTPRSAPPGGGGGFPPRPPGGIGAAGRGSPTAWPDERAGAAQDILILSTEARAPRPQGGPRSTPVTGGGPLRSRTAARRPRPAAPATPQAEPPRTRSGPAGNSAGPGPASELTPAFRPLGSASGAATTDTSSTSDAAAAQILARSASPPVPAIALRAALTTPERMRAAFLLNEILQPPLALRRPGSRRV